MEREHHQEILRSKERKVFAHVKQSTKIVTLSSSNSTSQEGLETEEMWKKKGEGQ